MLLSRNILLNLILPFVFSVTYAQDTLPAARDSMLTYPQGYFRNPLNIPLQLSANFGELRTNHYHMGFDIRTNQKENLPVYAAADGYVSRVKLEEEGFGRAIYITHPNGYTTLYAHLNDFYTALNDSVKQIQYNTQQWEQEIVFPPEAFPVTQGQIIAFSGNTGASQGPHLHFEIRDTKTGNNLNPWLFNFNLPDDIPPFIYRLYLFDRRYSTYEISPKIIGIRGAKGDYTSVADTVIVSTPKFSLGITSEDKTNGSPFLFGIYEAELWVDSSLRSAFTLNNISYNETRYLNAGIDYKTRLSGGAYIQHLSRLPGNRSSVFSKAGDGIIEITDTLAHSAVINVKDAAGNTSTLQFYFRYDSSKKQDLLFTANTTPLLPNKENKLLQDDIQLNFSDKAFYDTVPFLLKSTEAPLGSKAVSGTFYLHNPTIPAHDSFTVRLRCTKEIPDSLKNRVIIQLVSKRKVVAEKGSWINGWMEGKFRDLGTVRLLIDTTPPAISLSGWRNGGKLQNLRSIGLFVKDTSGDDIKKFTALLDGQWLMFSHKNDYYYVYKFDEHCSPGKHELKIIAEDQAGNLSERTYSFTR